MVISDVNRYVFIEVPQTASSALAAELIANYDGRRIFQKHTDYQRFFQSATEDERGYRVLACVRNPLDIVVSKFVKARDDHRSRYGKRAESGTPLWHRFRPEAREFAFISRHDADFGAYLRKFYAHTYNSRACLLPHSAHVLKYERLNEDFSAWLASLGLALLRPIPVIHATEGKQRNFEDAYTDELRCHAVRVFGPYMRRWGYPFPDGWSVGGRSAIHEWYFRADNLLRRFYMHRIHYGWVMPRRLRGGVSDPASQDV